jgi:hypothetical protein
MDDGSVIFVVRNPVAAGTSLHRVEASSHDRAAPSVTAAPSMEVLA